MTDRRSPHRSAEPPEDGGGGEPVNSNQSPPPSADAEGVSDDQAAALQSAADQLAGLAEEAAAGAIPTSPPSSVVKQGAGRTAATPQQFDMPTFEQTRQAQASKAIDLLSDVNLNVKIELGRTRMLVSDVLRLSEGSVVELDKLAGDPVDIYVNDRPIARGEVLVLNENFCVRINEILTQKIEPGKAAG